MKNKSFNTLTKEYRVERSNNQKDWVEMTFREDVYKQIVAHNYHFGSYFKEKPYKPYWWHQIKWFFQRSRLYKIITYKAITEAERQSVRHKQNLALKIIMVIIAIIGLIFTYWGLNK